MHDDECDCDHCLVELYDGVWSNKELEREWDRFVNTILSDEEEEEMGDD